MEDRCYLLSVGELLGEGSETLGKEAWGRVDGARREKAKRLQPGPAQAASLGAGLLLQLAVRDYMARENSAGGRSEREDTAEENSAGGRPEREDTAEENSAGGRSEREDTAEENSAGGRPEREDTAEENSTGGRSERENIAKEDPPGEKSGSRKQERGLLYGLHEYTVSRLLGSLPAPLELRMDYGEKGKPYLRDYPFYFNLSHSGVYVICAVSDREVGADIQRCSMEKGERLERIARRFFSPEELAALVCCREQAERAQLFYRLWTRKEAYGKLTGRGIGAALDKNFLPPGPEGETDGGSVLWQEWQYPSGYRIALCAQGTERSGIRRAGAEDGAARDQTGGGRGRSGPGSDGRGQRTERPGI